MIKPLFKQLKLPSLLQEVSFGPWEKFGVRVWVKRDDLIHPSISGNKWRKLYGHLLKYQQNSFKGVLTFGGAYSNHIIATAAACHYLDIPVYGVIRGEVYEENPAMKYAKEMGMMLIPLSREAYRRKDITSLIERYPEIDFERLMVVPEGGGGEEGVLGCKEILDEITVDYHYIVSAVGTGTTLAGLSRYANDEVEVVGVSVLKGADTISSYVESISTKENFEVIQGYHFGGYGRYTTELLQFSRDFMRQTAIPLDYVYTAKMIYAFDDLLKNEYFKRGSSVILLHTGGLMNAPLD